MDNSANNTIIQSGCVQRPAALAYQLDIAKVCYSEVVQVVYGGDRLHCFDDPVKRVNYDYVRSGKVFALSRTKRRVQ